MPYQKSGLKNALRRQRDAEERDYAYWKRVIARWMTKQEAAEVWNRRMLMRERDVEESQDVRAKGLRPYWALS